MREWLDIAAAPKDGQIIDLWHEKYGRMCDAWWDEEDGAWSSTGTPYGFTHWMPVPDAPGY